MHLPRRFNDALMSPPDARGPADAALLARLQAWCEDGAFPVRTDPLRVASISHPAGLDGAASTLDGSHELMRLGRWRGLWWRLTLLWRECVAARQPSPDGPWDCGWWREGPLTAADAFRPRRPTLLMVRETDPAVTSALLSALYANGVSYRQPLRILVVSAAPMAAIPRLP